jgi:hypothetical protein
MQARLPMEFATLEDICVSHTHFVIYTDKSEGKISCCMYEKWRLCGKYK